MKSQIFAYLAYHYLWRLFSPAESHTHLSFKVENVLNFFFLHTFPSLCLHITLSLFVFIYFIEKITICSSRTIKQKIRLKIFPKNLVCSRLHQKMLHSWNLRIKLRLYFSLPSICFTKFHYHL